MPTFSPDGFVAEESPAKGAAEPDRTLWISEAGGLTQFGAFVEVLQPGSRSSMKHWHSDEDEMVYVLEGELTVVEGNAETILGAGHAATFKAGVAQGHTPGEPQPGHPTVPGRRHAGPGGPDHLS
jgi:uncharacterized cupin superfamily protein